MSEKIVISQEDILQMRKVKNAIDNLTMQIGALEFKKTKMVANLNEYQIASEKFVADIMEKYKLPKDQKITIADDGVVTIGSEQSEEPQQH